MTKRALAAALASLVSACVSHDAGYATARGAVRERVDMDVAWSGDGADGSSSLKKKLLASPLTAESAARIALVSSPDVQVALEEIGIARGALVGALRLPNPHAGFGARFHGDGDVALDFDATIDLVELALVPARESAASHDLDASAHRAAAAILAVAFEAKAGFFEYQAASESLRLQKTVVFALAQSAEIARLIQEAGNAPELAALSEQALLEDAKLALTGAEAEELSARERLNVALGLFGEEAAAWRVESRLAEPDAFEPSELEKRAIEASLALRALRSTHAGAAARSDLGWAEGLMPGLGAGVGVERDGGEWGYGPRVELEVPLFYQGQGAVASAEAEMRRAQALHASTALRIRSAARVLTARVRVAGERARFCRSTLLPLRERMVEESLRQYNAMSSDLFRLLAAKRDQIETQQRCVHVLRDYWIARTEIDELLAGGMPASRARAPAPMEPAARPAAGGH